MVVSINHSAANGRYIVRIVGLLSLCSIFTQVDPARAQEKIAPAEALAVIESFENRFVRVQFDCEVTSWKFTDPNRLANLIADPRGAGCFQRGTVVFEPHSGRYRYDLQLVSPWKDGLAPFAGRNERHSFDGATTRQLAAFAQGVQLPGFNDANKPPEGLIDRERRGKLMKEKGTGSGLAFFPPHVYQSKLSELIRKQLADKKYLSIVKGPQTQWRIDTVDPTDSYGNTLSIHYDTKRGIVTQIDLSNGTPLTPFMRWEPELFEARPGYWVPSRIDQIQLLGKTLTRFSYRNVKVNEPVDDESIFRIALPPGTRVEDRIEQKFYIVGHGAAEERLKVQEFTEEYKLRLARENGELPPPPGSRWTKWLVGGGIAAGLLLACLFCRWKFKRAIAPTSALALLLLGPFNVGAAELNKDGEWVVSYAAGEEIRVSQCGLNITLFTLEHFGHTNYDLRQTVRALPPTDKGIRLSDICDVLDGYGLETFARQKVTVDTLRQAIRPGTIAILPVRTAADTNHYFIVLSDPARGIVLVDPPHSVTSLNDEWIAGQLAHFDGLVVFVREASSPIPQRDRIEVSPSRIDLGDVQIDDSKSSILVTHQVVVRNPTARPVMITAVGTSCGCMSCRWSGGLLAPGESQSIPVTILPNSWGKGRVERLMTIRYGDGTEAVISWVGTGVSQQSGPQLELLPDVVRIDLNDVSTEITAREFEVIVRHRAGPAPGLWVKAGGPHATASIVARRPSETHIRVRIKLPAERPVFQRRIDTLSVSLDRNGPSSEFRIELFQSPRFRAEPHVVTLRGSNDAASAVAIVPLSSGCDAPESLTVLESPAGVCVSPSSDSKKTALRVSATKTVKTGSHTVRCAVRAPGNSAPTPVEFVVVVPDARDEP